MKKILGTYLLITFAFAGQNVSFVKKLVSKENYEAVKKCPAYKEGLVNPTLTPFHMSLHHTTYGMAYWYSKKTGGFETLTNIPYQNLFCYKCHTANCYSCHGVKKGKAYSLSINKVYNDKTCYKCHARAKLAYMFDKKMHFMDVHIERGFTCADCHTTEEVHGDGTFKKHMLEAVTITCEDCHIKKAGQVVKLKSGLAYKIPAVKNTIPEHNRHVGDIACVACHMKTQISCLNCHFDNVLKTHKKIPYKNFFPTKSFTILANYKGKVYPANVMPLLYKDKTFMAIAPYFTHSVDRNGRRCKDCHANPDVVKAINRGVKLMKYNPATGKLEFAKGLIPFVQYEDGSYNIDMDYVKFGKNGLELVKRYTDKYQIILVKPLTPKQIERLKAKLKYEK